MTTKNNVLFIADEIQSALGRVGTTFACDRESVVPDVYLLGKALGGGILPLSAVVADRAVLGVIRPGEPGATFGGNPPPAAAGLRRSDERGVGQEGVTQVRSVGGRYHK